MTSEVIAHAPDWRRNQTAVTVATFIGYAGFTLVMPFLPLYFQQLGVHDPGAVALWSGLSLAVAPAVTALMTPAWARLAGRLGHKLMVERSLASFVVIMTLTGFARHPWQVLALRTLQGVFAGYGPIAMMLAAESSPPEHMAAAIGWVQTAQRLGPALGPVVGGIFAQAAGIRGAFFASAAMYFLALLIVVVGYREPATRRVVERARTHSSFRALGSTPHFVLFVAAIFSLQLVDRSFGPVLPMYLGEIGVPALRIPFMTGVIFTVAAACAAVGNQGSGWMLDRLPAARLVPLTSVIAAAAALAFWITVPIAMLIGAAAVLGFSVGAATTAIYAAAGRAASPDRRGLTFGYLQSAYLWGLAVSPVIAGVIGSFDMKAVFLADAIGLVALAGVVGQRMRA